MAELWQILVQLVFLLRDLLGALLALLLQWSLLLAWLAWWLGGVNWNKTWPVLAQGAWVPVVLLMLVAALVWAQTAPGTVTLLGAISVPNFWWQLGAVSLLVGLALFCGWLQEAFGWTPAEISLEPPAAAEHGHGHAH